MSARALATVAALSLALVAGLALGRAAGRALAAGEAPRALEAVVPEEPEEPAPPPLRREAAPPAAAPAPPSRPGNLAAPLIASLRAALDRLGTPRAPTAAALTARIEGAVRDEQGAPLAGVEVGLYLEDAAPGIEVAPPSRPDEQLEAAREALAAAMLAASDGAESDPGETPLTEMLTQAAARAADGSARGERRGRTGPDGRFTIAPLAPGRYSLDIAGPYVMIDERGARLEERAVEAGVSVEVRARALGRLCFDVAERRPAYVRFELVRLRAGATGADRTHEWSRCEADRTSTLLEAGAYLVGPAVESLPDDEASETRLLRLHPPVEVEVAPGPRETHVAVSVLAATRLTGRVLDGAGRLGETAARVRIRRVGELPFPGDRAAPQEVDESEVIAPAPGFEIDEPAEPGIYELRARWGGMEEEDGVDLSSGPPVVVEVRDGPASVLVPPPPEESEEGWFVRVEGPGSFDAAELYETGALSLDLTVMPRGAERGPCRILSDRRIFAPRPPEARRPRAGAPRAASEAAESVIVSAKHGGLGSTWAMLPASAPDGEELVLRFVPPSRVTARVTGYARLPDDDPLRLTLESSDGALQVDSVDTSCRVEFGASQTLGPGRVRAFAPLGEDLPTALLAEAPVDMTPGAREVVIDLGGVHRVLVRTGEAGRLSVTAPRADVSLAVLDVPASGELSLERLPAGRWRFGFTPSPRERDPSQAPEEDRPAERPARRVREVDVRGEATVELLEGGR